MDLIIAHPFLDQPGGSQRVVLKIAEKFNPIIYTIPFKPGSNFEKFKEFDVRVLPSSPLEKPFFFMKKDPRRSSAVAAGLRYFFTKLKDNYDVINAHGTPSEWIRNKNPRVCWYCHSPNREAFDLYEFRMRELSLPRKLLNIALISGYKVLEHYTVPKIEKIIANSEITKARIRKYLSRSDAEVITPGVDEKEFSNESYEKYFFYPSRFVPEKRFEYAIEAFKKFSAKNKNGWKLVLAGFLPKKERELKYFEKLKKLAEGLSVEFRIDISEKELRSLYANSYAVLFSAINEDWGLVPLEAMSCEKPCISVNEGGPVYSIIEGKTGFLVNSPEEMCERMLRLANNPTENEKMGKAGRQRVLKNYTWDIFLSKIECAFKETASKKANDQ